MPRISASYVYTCCGPPLRNGVVDLDGEGTVLSVSGGMDTFIESAGVEYFSGILIPGLADVMCGGSISGHRLLAGGVRVAGRIGYPVDEDGSYEDIPGTPHEQFPNRLKKHGRPPGLLWRHRYGGEVEYRVFRNSDHFEIFFRKGNMPGLWLFNGRGQEMAVLSGSGESGLLERMYNLQQGPESLTLWQLIDIAAFNGAFALGCDTLAGKISTGMRPGLSIIEGADLQNLQLLPRSRLRRLC